MVQLECCDSVSPLNKKMVGASLQEFRSQFGKITANNVKNIGSLNFYKGQKGGNEQNTYQYFFFLKNQENKVSLR
jgi:hypothetical protein